MKFKFWKVISPEEQAEYEWGVKPFPKFYDIGLWKFGDKVYTPPTSYIYFLKPFYHIVRLIKTIYIKFRIMIVTVDLWMAEKQERRKCSVS